MKTPWISLTLLALLCFAWVEPASATTWSEVEQACPLCDKTETYHAPASWGSYIYRAPSRLQLVFFPVTSPRALYSCTGCRYSGLLWDFKRELTKEQKEALRKALAKVVIKVEEVDEDDKEDPPLPYVRMHPLAKLEVAALIYDVLEVEDEARSHLFRTYAYHALRNEDPQALDHATAKCIEATKRVAADPKLEGKRKEALVILGAMERLRKSWDAADAHLEEAAKTTYVVADNPSASKNGDEFLGKLAKELRELVAKERAEKTPEKTAEKSEAPEKTPEKSEAPEKTPEKSEDR